MRFVFPAALVACLLFCSCASDTPATNKTDIVTTDTAKATAHKDSTSAGEEEKEEPDFVPANIERLGADNLVLPKPFDPLVALQRLFPGKYYVIPDPLEDTRNIKLEAWKCPTCKTQAFSGWFGEDPDEFPYRDGVLTQYKDTLLFTDDNNHRNILISFSSLYVQPAEMMSTSRFSCAILGLAWFTEVANGWQLKTFTPALGCYGAFQSLPDIHLLKLGPNNYGCYLTQSNGGAGGPFYAEIYAFGIVDGTFKVLLAETGVGRSGATGAEWKVVLGNATGTSSFGDLPLTISGTYSSSAFAEDGDTLTNVPQEILATAKVQDSFNFRIVRQYHFSNGAYKLAGSTVEKQ